MGTELVHHISMKVCKSITSILQYHFQYKGNTIFPSYQEDRNFGILLSGGKGFITAI